MMRDSLYFKISVVIALLITGSHAARSQARFVMSTSPLPSETESTWIDTFTRTSESRVDLPQGVSIPGFVPDSKYETNIFLTRRLKVLERHPDGSLKLQITYLQSSPDGPATQANESKTDLSGLLKDRTFIISCDTGSVVTPGENPPGVSVDESRIVRRECNEIQRFNNLKALINNMQVGEKKTFNSDGTGVSPFSEEFEQLGAATWNISLRQLITGTTSGGIFDLRADLSESNSTKSSFRTLVGEVTIDERGVNVDLTFKSSSGQKHQILPDGKSEITSQSNLLIRLHKEVTLQNNP